MQRPEACSIGCLPCRSPARAIGCAARIIGRRMRRRYRIEGVPTFVINGKYVADVRSADGQERLLSLVGDLAAQEHKH